jgi:hypothetical protein
MERRFLDRRLSACERGDTGQAAYCEDFWNRELIALEDCLEGECCFAGKQRCEREPDHEAAVQVGSRALPELGEIGYREAELAAQFRSDPALRQRLLGLRQPSPRREQQIRSCGLFVVLRPMSASPRPRPPQRCAHCRAGEAKIVRR